MLSGIRLKLSRYMYISKICYVDADTIFYSINFHKTKEKFIELDLIELLSYFPG